MANAREIKSRMGSIEDTRKITNAMYLISSTKLRKARKEREDAEPYFDSLRTAIERLMRHMPEFKHVFLRDLSGVPLETRRRGLIAVTADKGLAGAYNHNVIRETEAWLEEPGIHALFMIGEVGRAYFSGRDITIDTQFRYTAQNPSLNRARSIMFTLTDKYLSGEIDELDLVYTRMAGSMATEVERIHLLPLDPKRVLERIPEGITSPEIEMVPSPEVILDKIVPIYLAGFIYGSLVESYCAEQNARMTAMQSANDNAEKILKDLRIQYNRVRQAAITQEITEVAAGARAQKLKKSRTNAPAEENLT